MRERESHPWHPWRTSWRTKCCWQVDSSSERRGSHSSAGICRPGAPWARGNRSGSSGSDSLPPLRNRMKKEERNNKCCRPFVKVCHVLPIFVGGPVVVVAVALFDCPCPARWSKVVGSPVTARRVREGFNESTIQPRVTGSMKTKTAMKRRPERREDERTMAE